MRDDGHMEPLAELARGRAQPNHPYTGHWWPPGHIIGYEHSFIHTVFDLLEAIADGKNPSPDFHDGVRNQRILAAIEDAAARKQWVEILD